MDFKSPNELYHRARVYLTWKIKLGAGRVVDIVFKPKVEWGSERDKAYRKDHDELRR